MGGQAAAAFNKILVVAEYFSELRKMPGGQPELFQCVDSAHMPVDSRGRWFPSLGSPPSLPDGADQT